EVRPGEHVEQIGPAPQHTEPVQGNEYHRASSFRCNGGSKKPAKFEGALTAERTIRKSRECKKKTAAPALRPRHAPGQSRAWITVVAPPRIAVRRHASTFIVNDAPTSTPRPCSSSSHPRRRCTRRRRQPRSDGGNSGSRCSSTKHRDS